MRIAINLNKKTDFTQFFFACIHFVFSLTSILTNTNNSFSDILENTKGNKVCIRKIVLYMVFALIKPCQFDYQIQNDLFCFIKNTSYTNEYRQMG